MEQRHRAGSSSEVRTRRISYPIALAFLFSLLQANWTYTGYDASAHVAEETVGARMSSAWGVFLSVAVSAIVGFIFLLALTTHLPDLKTLFPATLDTTTTPPSSQYYFGGGYAVIEILKYNLDSIVIVGFGLGDLLLAGIADRDGVLRPVVRRRGRSDAVRVRRDDGLPASGWLKKVSHRYRTPANSLTGDGDRGLAVLGPGRSSSATGVAVVIVTAISTIFLYAAYGVVIYLGATTTDWLEHRVWSLGRWSKPIAWLAIFWVVVLMILFSWPTSGNISWPFMIGIVVLLLVYYFGWARTRFQGPRVQGGEAELTELEREFEQAAEHLGGTTTA